MSTAAAEEVGLLDSGGAASTKRGYPTGKVAGNVSSRVTILYAALGVLSVVAVSLVVALIVVATRKHSSARDVAGSGYSGLAGVMETSRLVAHLQALQGIANANSGTRAVAFGYNASLAYVEAQLTAHAPWLTVVRQPFVLEVPDLVGTPSASVSSAALGLWNLVYNMDFRDMTYSGSGTLTGPIFPVASNGCNASDFGGFTANAIAVIRRGTCTFEAKVLNAIAAGAAGVLISNYGTSEDTMGSFGGTLGQPMPKPVFGVSFGVGQTLRGAACDAPQVTMSIATTVFSAVTMNLLATTTTGDASQTIVVGSHLDSVEAGPGINDNGSGSAMNLELALNLPAAGTVRNRVRFAWWGAEELGLLGSTYYVETLTDAEAAATACNLNFDMLGSTNGFQGVYNATSSTNTLIREPSVVLQTMLEAQLKAHAVPYRLTDFTGRSDYGPFLDRDIAAGGLDSGADEIKTPAERDVFGGSANVVADTCYHQPCDTIGNVDTERLLALSRTAAAVLQQLATSSNLKNMLHPSGTTGAAASAAASAVRQVEESEKAAVRPSERWFRGRRQYRE